AHRSGVNDARVARGRRIRGDGPDSVDAGVAREFLGAFASSVPDIDAFSARIGEREHDRPRGPTGAKYENRPSGRVEPGFAPQGFDESDSVCVVANKSTVAIDDDIDCAD